MSKNEHEMPDLNMIIIKRGQPQEEHPHGGAWKVAFADFMTAMMAFFLVLWIVNSTNKETRSSVARYFNPIRISDTTPARKGLKDPKEADFDAASGDERPKAKIEGTPVTEGQKPAVANVMQADSSGQSQQGSGSRQESHSSHLFSDLVDPAIVRDPFLLLDEIAGKSLVAQNSHASPVLVDAGFFGPQVFRDPFAPMSPVLPSQSQMAHSIPLPVPFNAQETKVGENELVAPALTKADAGRQAAFKKSMNDVTALRESIGTVLRESGLQNGPKLEVKLVEEGILISLTDDLNFGMFAVGSSEPQARFVRAMEKIGSLLAKERGSFVLRGHTDARPFRSRAFDNWRLSSARAQMAAYMLMRGNLEESRIERVEGHADRLLKNPNDPYAAENRRIEILLRRAS